ncbi:hypothetical protein SEA_RYADEL_9 [Mycobacterium phage Ryadel]|uniref:Uncharacterized protein n=1 Tax=Mycobacterium phage Ryadel TaxID=2283292 RepID=A0A345MEY3_9CAUD|nr:hypothetical protein KNU03_gp009 [Mycobacterium phage Ryadel]AXH69114.1 hypothetical protein SEA_RYADEL_9 [Mycobacterium phage Ryadel]
MPEPSLGEQMRDAWDRNTPVTQLPWRVNMALAGIALGTFAVLAILFVVTT